MGSFSLAWFVRVRPEGHCVLSGSSGSLECVLGLLGSFGLSGSSRCALGVACFVRVRLLRSGASWWLFRFVWFVCVRLGGSLCSFRFLLFV